MISIKSLHKYFNKNKQNEIHVINDINLDLPEQGMVALFGKSGCGKTTLLNAIGGLDKTESGSVLIDGENIKNKTDVIRNHYIGYIFQNYNLNKQETIFDNVADALRLCGMTDKAQIEERVMAALTNVGMDKYKLRTPDTLSGGQMQRVAIARAIVKNPKIILADEPTGNLDEANTLLIMDLLKKIAETHLVVLVTHEANLVDYYCDKVIELSDGKIISTRDNYSANGFAARSKNDIYLGELTKSEASAGGVNLEYYGSAPSLPIKLRIVNSGGKIYLSVDDEKIQILDRTSEVKLREGVYTEIEKAEENKANIDMSKLPPIEGSRFGRLFNFKGSFKSGYNANFKKNKKSTTALRACMFLFSLVLVFMSANLGTAFKSISDVKEKYNQNMFYIYTNSATISEKLNTAVGQNGIDNLQITTGIPTGNGTITVSPGKFESFSTSDARFKAYTDCLDIKFAGEMNVLVGKADNLGSDEVVITNVLADRLIEASTVGYVKTYADLIGLYASFYSSAAGSISNLRIVGIISSDESCMYRSSLVSASHVLQNLGISKDVQVNNNGAISLSSGEAAIIIRNETNDVGYPKKGESIKINGKSFTVKEVYSRYNDYATFLKTKNSELVYTESMDDPKGGNENTYIIDVNQYLRNKVKALYPELDEWSVEFNEQYNAYAAAHYHEFFEKLYEPLDEFIKHNHMVSPSFESWLYLEKGIADMKYNFTSYNNMEYYYIQKYKAENGVYPDYSVFNNNFEEINAAWEAFNTSRNSYYDQYINEYYSQYNYLYNNVYLITEADYISLANIVGESHETITANSAGISVGISGEIGMKYYGDVASDIDIEFDRYRMCYTAIHSSNPEATEAFLNSILNEDLNNVNLGEYQKKLYTPDGIFDDLMSDFKSEVVTKLIVLAVFLVVMSLCMYFIMRSSLMSRIKEVGIYRAIGVSRRNLIFRFLVEAFVLTTFTVFIGYVISSGALFALSASVSLLDSILYYPVWLAVAILAILYAVCLACGLIPITTLLRKTPSEILSKYDI